MCQVRSVRIDSNLMEVLRSPLDIELEQVAG